MPTYCVTLARDVSEYYEITFHAPNDDIAAQRAEVMSISKHARDVEPEYGNSYDERVVQLLRMRENGSCVVL